MFQSHPTALVALPLNQAQKERFLQAAPQVSFTFKDPGEVVASDLEDAEILIGRISPALCPRAVNARWFQAQAAGPDSYLKPGVLPSQVVLTSAVGAYGQAVSEHLLAMTLCLMKRLHTYRDSQHLHLWESQGQVSSLRGATVLVIGLGDIGDSYARLCAALGARVLGVRRTRTEVPDHMAGIFNPDHLDQVLPQADVVCLCLPHSSQTAGLMNSDRLAKMKPGAILLNGGRGSAIQTDALIPLLESGHLKGVGLDVTDPEPLPPDHPLWDMPGALITPHVSGFFHLPQTLDHLVDLTLDNLDRYLSGKPLGNVVNR